LSGTIICFGVILRFAQYLYNRSLWLDEASLALNIVERSLSELLFIPLESLQGAPLGFLAVEKILILTFGNNEYTLRLFPFLAGIISLFLFHRVSKKILTKKAALIALGLFAISGPLIYYSQEVKQYSSDVAIALLIYMGTFYLLATQKFTLWRAIFFGLIGAIAIWFSHPAVFLLASVGTVFTLYYIKEEGWQKFVGPSMTLLIWFASFAIYYFFSVKNLVNNVGLLSYWAGSFAPLPLKFWQARWYFDSFFHIFKDPVGISLSGIAAFLFIIGCISMFQEKRKAFFLLISPMLITLFASGLHVYPFSGRFLLFLVPNALLFIAEGGEQMRAKLAAAPVIGITLISLLFFYPLVETRDYLIHPPAKEEIRPVVTYLEKFKQNNDVLYLYYGSQNAFKYYSEKNDFHEDDYIVGVSSRENWENYTDDLNKLLGNERVWILFSHVYDGKGVDEEKFFLYHLDRIGKKLDAFKSDGASVYLYDLSSDIANLPST
jgi:uncharacterized membrane protein